MGGGQSTANVQQAAEIAKLKRQLAEAQDKVANLEGKVGKDGVTKAAAIMSHSDSGAEDKFSRPDETQKKKKRVEVSAEIMHGKYEKKVVEKPPSVKAMLVQEVDASILFKNLTGLEKADCVDAFYSVEAKKDDVVIRQGDVGHNFYIVEGGTLSVSVQHSKDGPSIVHQTVVPGKSFGELALLYNTPRAATVVALEDVKLWALDRQTYRGICQFYKGQRSKKHMAFLRKVPDLKTLSNRELINLAEAMEEEVYEPGEFVVRQGEKGDYFYIIVQGDVDVEKDGNNVATLKPGDYFGERALLKEDTRDATCIAKSRLTVLSINRASFVEMLGALADLLDRKPPAEEEDTPAAGNDKYHKAVGFDDLVVGKTLGCGAFGRVKLVKDQNTGDTYALKCLIKADIVQNNLQDHVLNERNVMLMLDHPFILKLHNSYKDDKFIYFLLELALGGELFTFLRKAGRFNEKASRFYATSVILGFEQLHNKNIVYRDLKPENLILDANGYLKIVDFGLAKVVTDRTWTLCGTPDYLAPEIILSKGHNRAVDYWALGVLIYEMSAGFVPFYSDDPMEVYQLILACDLKFPSHFSRACMDLVSKLMMQNQTKRLGNMKNGIRDIIKHKWFSGFDWDGLLKGKLNPPIKPIVKNSEDMSNFDEYPEDDQDVPTCTTWDPAF